MKDLINRQEAIEAILSIKDYGNSDRANALGLAEFAITTLPSAQPEPSTDIQDVLRYLDDVLHPLISPNNWNVYSELHDMVSSLPSAQSEIIRCKDCKYCDRGIDEDGNPFLKCLGG